MFARVYFAARYFAARFFAGPATSDEPTDRPALERRVARLTVQQVRARTIRL